MKIVKITIIALFFILGCTNMAFASEITGTLSTGLSGTVNDSLTGTVITPSNNSGSSSSSSSNYAQPNIPITPVVKIDDKKEVIPVIKKEKVITTPKIVKTAKKVVAQSIKTPIQPTTPEVNNLSASAGTSPSSKLLGSFTVASVVLNLILGASFFIKRRIGR